MGDRREKPKSAQLLLNFCSNPLELNPLTISISAILEKQSPLQSEEPIFSKGVYIPDVPT